MPSTVPSRVAAGATMRMSRAPTITRESTSRPTRSVPNRCDRRSGGARSLSGSVAKGSSGASASPKMAKITKITTITAPAMNVLERASSRRRSRWAVRSTAVGGAAAEEPEATSGPEADVLIARSRGGRGG